MIMEILTGIGGWGDSVLFARYTGGGGDSVLVNKKELGDSVRGGILSYTPRKHVITKTCPCNVYPLEPHFYIAKLGYAGVYLFFLF